MTYDMNRMKLSSVLILSGFVFLGCSKETEVVESQLPERYYEDFSPVECLVKVGDNVYTKNDCERNATLTKILKGGNIFPGQKLNPTLKEKKLALGSFVAYAAVMEMIKSSGENLVWALNTNRLQYIKKRVGRRWKQFSEIAKERLERDAVIAAYVDRAVKDKDELNVSNAEIEYIHMNIKRSNEVASMTNALVYALATNVYDRIKKGENFNDLAAKYDECPELDGPGTWGEVTATYLQEEPSLLEVIRATPVGSVTVPVEGDGGLLLVKVIDKSGSGAEVVMNKDPERYVLGRIYFRLPQFYKEETIEETRANIYATKRRKFAKKIIDEAIKSVKVEFPSGKIIWRKKRL